MNINKKFHRNNIFQYLIVSRNTHILISIKDELIESGYGFILRTNSKYIFNPEQRDELENQIVEELNICKKLM